jgi:hypothetical protein
MYRGIAVELVAIVALVMAGFDAGHLMMKRRRKLKQRGRSSLVAALDVGAVSAPGGRGSGGACGA